MGEDTTTRPNTRRPRSPGLSDTSTISRHSPEASKAPSAVATHTFRRSHRWFRLSRQRIHHLTVAAAGDEPYGHAFLGKTGSQVVHGHRFPTFLAVPTMAKDSTPLSITILASSKGSPPKRPRLLLATPPNGYGVFEVVPFLQAQDSLVSRKQRSDASKSFVVLQMRHLPSSSTLSPGSYRVLCMPL